MIEHAILKYLGIYPETIEKYDEVIEQVCEEYGIDSDKQVWEYVKQAFDENVFDGNLTNEILSYMFRNLGSALVEAGKFDEQQIDWYVNGWDSHFYIDGCDA